MFTSRLNKKDNIKTVLLLAIAIEFLSCKDKLITTESLSINNSIPDNKSEETSIDLIDSIPPHDIADDPNLYSFMQEYKASNYTNYNSPIKATMGQDQIRYTCQKVTPVYKTPNSDKQIFEIPPFTSVTIKYEGKLTKGSRFLFIAVRGSNNPQMFGYIQEDNLSIGATSNNFLLCKENKYNKGSNSKKDFFKILYTPQNINKAKIKVEDAISYTLDTVMTYIDYYDHFDLNEIDNNLKENPPIAIINWNHEISFPKFHGTFYVLKTNNGKIIPLPESWVTGRYGHYKYQKIYIPTKNVKGETILFDNNNMSNIDNPELYTLAYPKDCGIPINQLIVKEEIEQEANTEDEGIFMEDNERSLTLRTTRHIFSYYKWTGSSVEFVSQKVIIK